MGDCQRDICNGLQYVMSYQYCIIYIITLTVINDNGINTQSFYLYHYVYGSCQTQVLRCSVIKSLLCVNLLLLIIQFAFFLDTILQRFGSNVRCQRCLSAVASSSQHKNFRMNSKVMIDTRIYQVKCTIFLWQLIYIFLTVPH